MKRALLCLLAIAAVLFCVSLLAAQSKPKAPIPNAVDLTDDMTPPRLLEVAEPNYTEAAKKKKIEGDVILVIVVDKEGNVVDAKVKKGLDPGLDANAIEAAKYYKFKPALDKDGNPIAVRMETTITFYLHD